MVCSRVLLRQSIVTLDVKPLDDETDMEALKNSVRSIKMDGLVWGLGELVALGYGINKYRVILVIGESYTIPRTTPGQLFTNHVYHFISFLPRGRESLAGRPPGQDHDGLQGLRPVHRCRSHAECVPSATVAPRHLVAR